MNDSDSNERLLLLQKHFAGELNAAEAEQLRELLTTDPGLLDQYLDLCDLDQQLATLSMDGPHRALDEQGRAIDELGGTGRKHARGNESGGDFDPLPNDPPAPVIVGLADGSPVAGRPLPLSLVVVACVVLALGVVVMTAQSPSVGTVIAQRNQNPDSNEPHATDDRPTVVRRSPNPWKVINSSGSMNHPGLTEASVPSVVPAKDRPIEFNRDIRPILSETCFHCHGPDEHGRRADLRLDTLEGATADLGGYQPIMPGDLAASEAWTRIISDDPDLLMPPPESHLVLSEEQKTLLRRWIEQGAVYQGHWAFIPPAAVDIPNVDFQDEQHQTHWVRNSIDSLVAARLAESGLTPSAQADPRTLVRRLSLDLTGLPPTMKETLDFVRDYDSRGEAAYQDTITRLLESPHFGERMALRWLDQARYADTNGYSIDGGRDMWLWRDWVIQAYNDNLPFDQFVIEQLAGDLIPDATEAQKVATGFNRNHMITHEGGTIPEENLTNYAADRVKTTSEVFLGLTMGCAQCHDHKYDPISQKEYYQFFAFFNELGDKGLDGNGGVNAAPAMNAQTVLKTDELGDVERERDQLERQLAESTEGLDAWLEAQRTHERSRGAGFGFVDAVMLDVSSPNRPGPFEFKPDGSVILSAPSGGLNGFSHSVQLTDGDQGESSSVSGLRIEFVPKELVSGESGEDKRLALTPFGDGVPKVTTVLVSATAQPADQVDYHQQIRLAKATASSHAAGSPPSSLLDERNLEWWQPEIGDQPSHLTLTFSEPIDPRKTPYLSVLVFFGRGQSLPFEWRIRPFRGSDTDSPWNKAIADAIAMPADQWDDDVRSQVLDAFRRHAPGLDRLRVRIANLQQRHHVLTSKHSTLVMNTAARPRETFVLDRGQYDARTERVTAQTPGVLPAMRESMTKPVPSPAENDPSETDAEESESAPEPADEPAENAAPVALNRLDLAKWLVRPDHPLTSRVAVNRIWKIFFGTGLVATSADFGSQGEYPSHPELLDHLATHFVDIGWNQKQLIREIVSSATYRQTSLSTDQQRELDPKNRLLARGPRFRLSAELIRDQALAVSGLLVKRIGGPSVQPYQPPALWKEVSHFGSTPATKQVFVQDRGEKLYRRSLYTIVKRTSPHPAMAAFDAPNREMCTVDRGATNTPLQALVTLNDPQFAEAARVLAAACLNDSVATDDPSRIERAFQRVVCRVPVEQEVEALVALLQSERQRFRETTGAASAAVAIGEWPTAEHLDPVEQAAWMQIATVLLNLSETLTRG